MLTQSILEAREGRTQEYEYVIHLQTFLLELWYPNEGQEITEAPNNYQGDSAPLFSRKAPTPSTWLIAFTPSFQKSISKIDKTLQGRVLIAISELSEEPVAVAGDTVKPLSGDLKGLWRYRIGDYRLIYQPDECTSKVVLLELSPRGSSYE
jgi:addiction module RelE/StbE family toxin